MLTITDTGTGLHVILHQYANFGIYVDVYAVVAVGDSLKQGMCLTGHSMFALHKANRA